MKLLADRTPSTPLGRCGSRRNCRFGTASASCTCSRNPPSDRRASARPGSVHLRRAGRPRAQHQQTTACHRPRYVGTVSCRSVSKRQSHQQRCCLDLIGTRCASRPNHRRSCCQLATMGRSASVGWLESEGNSALPAHRSRHIHRVSQRRRQVSLGLTHLRPAACCSTSIKK